MDKQKLKLVPIEDVIDEIEGGDEDIDLFSIDSPVNDLDWWRKVMYSYKKKETRLRLLEKQRDSIVDAYIKKITIHKNELLKHRGFMIDCLEYSSEFTTKTGGRMMDYFPDIGTFSLSTERKKVRSENDPHFMSKGFKRVSISLDQTKLNEYFKTCIIKGGQVLDPETKEPVDHVSIEYKRSCSLHMKRDGDSDDE